ncbi:undecaprenyl-diphosphate phosphatase [Candidatus Dependentiae bacterium]|nr:undecaprenyl-diphosphate phosphatase [Candidatus Dependentiae bacterium]MCG2756088.1 undecaprenyl-diphosphate phosphatase [Candidatus Dependentiae bacterium]
MIYLIIIIFLQMILESLPVSSSGHLLLAEKFFQTTMPKYFDYFLHGPTILILLIIFYKEWFPLAKCLATSTYNKKMFAKFDSHKKLLKIFLKIITLVAISNAITTLIWFIFKFYLEKKEWFGTDIHLLIGFCVTTLFLFLLSFKERQSSHKSHLTNLNKATVINSMTVDLNIFAKYLILGIIQGLALFPGISRFASVYAASRFLNFTPKRAFQITFLLELPLISAGFLLGVYHINKINDQLSFLLFFAIAISTIISAIIFYFVKRLALANKLHYFFYYMIIPITILVFIILKHFGERELSRIFSGF